MIDLLCKPIIKNLSINKFVETGIFEAETTAQVAVWFAELHPEFGQIEKMVITGAKGINPWNSFIPYPVFKDAKGSHFKIYSVDNNAEYADNARKLFESNPNIIISCQSSEKFLRDLLDRNVLSEHDNCFFFLDAHWGDYWPLRDEIEQVLRLQRFAIVIDDFVVPGNKDCAFNGYHGKACGWKYIKDLFKHRKLRLYYPRHPNRDYCGWGIILSGYSDDELFSMEALPMVKGEEQ